MSDLSFAKKLFEMNVEVTRIIPLSWNQGLEDLEDLLDDLLFIDQDSPSLALVGLPDVWEHITSSGVSSWDASMLIRDHCDKSSIDGFFVNVEAKVFKKQDKGILKPTCVSRIQWLFVPFLKDVEAAVLKLIEDEKFIGSIRVEQPISDLIKAPRHGYEVNNDE